MRSHTSASVSGASDAVFMENILAQNGAIPQENGAMATSHVRLAAKIVPSLAQPNLPDRAARRVGRAGQSGTGDQRIGPAVMAWIVGAVGVILNQCNLGPIKPMARTFC
jgi:hypothetical protein